MFKPYLINYFGPYIVFCFIFLKLKKISNSFDVLNSKLNSIWNFQKLIYQSFSFKMNIFKLAINCFILSLIKTKLKNFFYESKQEISLILSNFLLHLKFKIINFFMMMSKEDEASWFWILIKNEKYHLFILFFLIKLLRKNMVFYSFYFAFRRSLHIEGFKFLSK